MSPSVMLAPQEPAGDLSVRFDWLDALSAIAPALIALTIQMILPSLLSAGQSLDWQPPTFIGGIVSEIVL